ncbi:MAG TPA: DUF4153 domain-containing protein [Longimicrobium sp.]|jgi:hypothetical protein
MRASAATPGVLLRAAFSGRRPIPGAPRDPAMKLPGTALRAYSRDARDAFVHAPVEVLMGVALAVTFSISLRQDDAHWWVRIFAAAVIALPLVFGASVLRARGLLSARARWGATALVLACVGAYAAWIYNPRLESEGWRAVALAGAAWLALLLAAFPGEETGRRRRFWRFDALLLGRILAVGLYGAALLAALAGAVAAVTSLFELRRPEHLYEDLAGAVFFALVPWVVAGGVPVLAAEGDGGSSLTAVRRAGRYLYAVVLVVYLAILFAYTIKVAVTGDLPRNTLSPIVLFAGIAGLLGGIFLEPLQDDPETRGVARLVRLFPALLLPLLPLPIWAVGVRQDQYGWTEFRYLRLLLLAALAVLAVWGTVRLVRRRGPLLSPVPAVLAAALLLGSVGPWSAQAVSRRDQSARLRAALIDAGLLRGGRLVRPLVPPQETVKAFTTLTAKQHERVTGTLAYLYDAHGPAVTGRVLGTRLRGYGAGWEVVSALAVRPGCARPAARSFHGWLPDGTPIQTGGGTVYLVDSQFLARSAPRAPRLTLEGNAAVVTVPGASPWTARAELGPLVPVLRDRRAGACEALASSADLELAEARIPLTDATGRSRGELVVLTVDFNNDWREGARRQPDTPLRLSRVEAMLIARP